MLKVAVYAIAKNEAKFIDRFMASARDADLILIADTGSTDGTRDILLSYPWVTPNLSISPWRFDVARNAALALVPADIDICVSLDLDEELQPGWRQEIERLWTPTTTRMRYLFDWGAGIRFKAEKIHSRHGYHWRYPCHESLFPYGIEESWVESDRLLAVHNADASKPRSQYLPLLKMAVEEHPHDPRMALYHARELSFYNEPEKANAEFKRYLAMPEATWNHERSYAYRFMAKGSVYDKAEYYLFMAIGETPDIREPWRDLAMLAYNHRRWAECYSHATRALEITHRENLYTTDPEAWGAGLHDLAAISAWNMGMRETAILHGRAAVEIDPADIRLAENLKWYSGLIKEAAE